MDNLIIPKNASLDAVKIVAAINNCEFDGEGNPVWSYEQMLAAATAGLNHSSSMLPKTDLQLEAYFALQELVELYNRRYTLPYGTGSESISKDVHMNRFIHAKQYYLDLVKSL